MAFDRSDCQFFIVPPLWLEERTQQSSRRISLATILLPGCPVCLSWLG